MALAQSSKKEGSRRRVPKHPEWSQGGPKKRKTLVALQKKSGLGCTDTQIEVGGARDESSCLQVGSVG